MTGLIRVVRAGSEAVSESQAACEGRCVRLALTGGCPRPEEPLGAKPAMVRSRRAEGELVSGFETGATRARGRWVEPVRDVWSLGANPRPGRAAEGPGPAWV